MPWSRIALAVLLAAIAGAVALAFSAIKPAPPKRLVIAIAPDEGGARYYARRYKEILQRDGIALDVRETSGSRASLDLLASRSADVALVQGGVEGTKQDLPIVTLASVAYVPLWIFHRGAADDISLLTGKRIAIGMPEGATNALARKVLAAAGADGPPSVLLPIDRNAAIEQLRRGDIDALFMVAPAEAPLVKKLAVAPGIDLMSVAHADAYVHLLPFLSKLVLPRGVFDIGSDIPEKDTLLLSPTENLLAHRDLHPALAVLLLRAATEVHSSAGLLDKLGEFPSARETGFPMSPEAARYLKSGPPFLQRYLPFWAAVLVDRLWVMLLPIVAIAIPLGRLLPPLYAWRMRRRVFRWYARLKEIELTLEGNPDRSVLPDMLRRLDQTEQAVQQLRLPLSYADNLYSFRTHVELVRQQILRKLAEPP